MMAPPSGEKAMLSTAVRDHRRAALAAVMTRLELDALLLTGADTVEFATAHGLTVQAWERPYALALTRAGRAAALMPDIAANKIKAQQARGSIWLDEVVYYAEHPIATDRPLIANWPAALAALLDGLGLARGRIGVDGAGGAVARALALLPAATALPVQPALRDVRLVKHPDEIETMRRAAALADWALARYRDALAPGQLIAALDFEVAAATVTEAAARLPGEDFQILKFHTLSGPASASPHGDGAQTGARVLADAPTVVIANVRLNGLSVEDQRTFVCGRASPEIARLLAVARQATEAGLAAVVAGRPVSGIDAAARTVIERAGHGAHLLHRTGHGIGVATHEFPEDMPFNARPLLAGEVYVVEPGIYVPGLGGFRFVDMAAVGAAPDRLTHAASDEASIMIA
jgi:Xaa-Pro aminopeptidase